MGSGLINSHSSAERTKDFKYHEQDKDCRHPSEIGLIPRAVFAPKLYFNGPPREQIHCGEIGSLVVDQPSHPILLVSLQGPMQEISGHLLIFVQPLNDKGLKPPGMERGVGPCHLFSL